MSNVNQSAQAAEDAMILNQCNVQLAQVKYNNSKVDAENKLALHFLHQFQKAFKKMEKLVAAQNKKIAEAKKIQDILRVVAIVGAVLACCLGQPEIAALIIVTTCLSMIPSGQKDKNGNSLSLMDVIVKDLAKILPGGDTPENELWVSIGIAVILTVLTCGAGAGVAADEMGFAAAKALLPLALAISLGGTGLPERVSKAIEANKQDLSNFTAIVGVFVNGINDRGGHVKMPNQETIKLILTLLITVAFVIVSFGATFATMKNLGNSSTLLGMIGPRLAVASRAASRAAKEAASVIADILGMIGQRLATALRAATEAASVVADDAGIELQEIAAMGDEAADAAGGTADGVANAVRDTASATNIVGRLSARIAGMMRSFATWCRVQPMTALGAAVTLGYAVDSAVAIYKDTQLAANYVDQGTLIKEQGTYGVVKTDSSFQLKLINMIADNDSKILQTEWQGDAALQEGFSHFSADANAIANALLG